VSAQAKAALGFQLPKDSKLVLTAIMRIPVTSDSPGGRSLSAAPSRGDPSLPSEGDRREAFF